MLPATHRRPVSWPMYAVDSAAVASFWADLRSALRVAGVADVPDELSMPEDLVAHWSDPALLLSQTCGLPYVTALHGRVGYVCTPRFRIEGCENGFYRSAIVVRADEAGAALADLAGRRVAYNGADSHSGYNAMRAMVAERAGRSRFFAEAIVTGSHRASLAALRSGTADIAAIDAVTLGLVKRFRPDETSGLRVIGYTEAAPGLPLITSALADEAQIRRLRDACAVACDPARSAARELLLDGIEIMDENAYVAIRDMQTRAEGLGYPRLA